MTTLPCFKCSTQLKPVFQNSPELQQPHKGTCFQTYGHYGSTVFDPMDGTILEINICDNCLTEFAQRVHLVEPVVQLRPPDLKRTVWKAPE